MMRLRNLRFVVIIGVISSSQRHGHHLREQAMPGVQTAPPQEETEPVRSLFDVVVVHFLSQELLNLQRCLLFGEFGTDNIKENGQRRAENRKVPGI